MGTFSRGRDGGGGGEAVGTHLAGGSWRHTDDEFQLADYRSFLAFPHIRGLAGFGPHPLFDGLHQGTYTWAPSEGEAFDWVTYRQARPERSRVVAVERSFIHLNAERVVAWEQGVGQGGILCIGAYTHFNPPDPLLVCQLQALVANAVVGEAIPHRRRTALDRAEIADEQIQSDEVFDARVREEAAGEAMSGDRWESQS